MSATNKIDWAALIEKALKNDQSAIEQLYNLTYPQAYSVALQMMKNEQDAMDVLQDAYVSAFKNLQSLKEPATFKAWFNKIVGNRCKDYLRKHKDINFSDMEVGEDIEFEDTIESDSIEFSPEESVDYSETKRLVNEILQALPEEQRLCILMYYYNELSVKEIAETLHCTEGTIKSRLNYGRKKIKEDVQALAKKGTKLYGIAPIPFIVWMLRSHETESAVTKTAVDVWTAVKGGTVAAKATTTTATVTTTTATATTATATSAATVAASVGATKVGLIIIGVVAAAAITGGSIVAINSESKPETEEKITISQTVKTITVEAGDSFDVKATDFLQFNADIEDEITIDCSTVDTFAVGEYDVIATYDGEEYVLSVVVEDTTAPLVRLKECVFYHKDDTKWDDLELIIDETFDYSEYTEEILGCEKIAAIEAVNVDYITALRSNIPEVPETEELVKEPTTAGVYRMVLAVKDIYENTTLREVYIIFGESEKAEIDIEEVLEESAEQVPHEEEVVIPVFPDDIEDTDTTESEEEIINSNDTVASEGATEGENMEEDMVVEEGTAEGDIQEEEIVLANGEYIEGCLIYIISNGQAYVKATDTNISGTIVIPSSYGGCPVVRIISFKNCDQITAIDIPKTVTTIDGFAFFNCSSLVSVNIPDSVTYMKSTVFANCTSLKSATIGSGLQELWYDTFQNCTSLESIKGCDGLVIIAKDALKGCESLKSIEFGNCLAEIDFETFKYCPNLIDIYYSGTEEQWDNISKNTTQPLGDMVTVHYNQ